MWSAKAKAGWPAGVDEQYVTRQDAFARAKRHEGRLLFLTGLFTSLRTGL